MNNRQRMYASNRLARQMMLKEGYDHIWFKPHTKRKDLVYSQKGNYLITDLWNLFDGICFDMYGTLTFFQVKTNAWASSRDMIEFTEDKRGFDVLILNVKKDKKNKKYEVLTREIKKD